MVWLDRPNDTIANIITSFLRLAYVHIVHFPFLRFICSLCVKPHHIQYVYISTAVEYNVLYMRWTSPLCYTQQATARCVFHCILLTIIQPLEVILCFPSLHYGLYINASLAYDFVYTSNQLNIILLGLHKKRLYVSHQIKILSYIASNLTIFYIGCV